MPLIVPACPRPVVAIIMMFLYSALTPGRRGVVVAFAFAPHRPTSRAAANSMIRSMSSSSSPPTTDWTTDKVRATFIEYFQNMHQHSFQPSSACAPLNDPTLLFTNAGMNQFKPIFLGQVDPNSSLAKLKRAVNSQKCIRAGGKHNDLEDVGRDTYHHTFFEMLGTWSFGDYFKKEAIAMAWDLLTNTYQLNPERIYATYFEGNEQIPEDVESRDFWLEYLPPERVIPCGAGDNFWMMGETGPCGAVRACVECVVLYCIVLY
jgi:alanyl-tRNA synthetase